MFGYRSFIIYISFLFFSVFFMGSHVSAEEGEKRTGFFATDLIGEFTDDFSYYGTALDIQFGVQLVPQHSFALGIRLPHRGSGSEGYLSKTSRTFSYDAAVLLKYNYDFKKYGRWIPGGDFSIFLGDSPGTRRGLDRFTFGINAGLFLRGFISENMAVLLRVGIGSNWVTDISPRIGPYIGMGMRWYVP